MSLVTQGLGFGYDLIGQGYGQQTALDGVGSVILNIILDSSTIAIAAAYYHTDAYQAILQASKAIPVTIPSGLTHAQQVTYISNIFAAILAQGQPAAASITPI